MFTKIAQLKILSMYKTIVILSVFPPGTKTTSLYLYTNILTLEHVSLLHNYTYSLIRNFHFSLPNLLSFDLTKLFKIIPFQTPKTVHKNSILDYVASVSLQSHRSPQASSIRTRRRTSRLTRTRICTTRSCSSRIRPPTTSTKTPGPSCPRRPGTQRTEEFSRKMANMKTANSRAARSRKTERLTAKPTPRCRTWRTDWDQSTFFLIIWRDFPIFLTESKCMCIYFNSSSGDARLF